MKGDYHVHSERVAGDSGCVTFGDFDRLDLGARPVKVTECIEPGTSIIFDDAVGCELNLDTVCIGLQNSVPTKETRKGTITFTPDGASGSGLLMIGNQVDKGMSCSASFQTTYTRQ